MRLFILILAVSIIACGGCVGEKKQADIKEDGQQNSIALGAGFHALENWSGVETRWMQDNAEFTVKSTESQTSTLGLRVMSFYHNRTMEIYSGSKLLVKNVIPAVGFTDIMVPIHLVKGTNSFKFHTIESCERPIDIKALNNPDKRCLSMAMQNMTILQEQS
jgi:hypothetical protein